MTKKKASNTFNKGMKMDLNPLNTPNDVMTSCLNGTIITYNGNEYCLQSDMGNGRVETAYLPAGYIPVGMAEFGGIIYVVSYNPLIGKSQIGSFPSPERNIDSTEISQAVIQLSNADFGFTNKASVFYVQKDLHDIKLNPGDKFIVYASTGDVSGNINKLYDCLHDDANAITNKMVQLSIATITDEGKIVKLNNLRRYDVAGGKYIIPEMTRNSSTGIPDLESYRSVVSSPYNVFNNRVSGKLVLVAELLTIDSFNVSIDYIMTSGKATDVIKDVNIVINVDYESDEDIFMYAINAELNDSDTGDASGHFMWVDNQGAISPGSMDSTDNVRANETPLLMYTIKDYDTKERPERTVEYTITPCMMFGPINYLAKSGIIQIDKIGTGYMELYEWRYYRDNENMQLSWAFQAYPESGHFIKNVKFIMSCYVDESTIETIKYNVSSKKSYNGSFTENIPFNKEHYKISDNKTLKPDKLYFVTIEVQYCKEDNPENTDKYVYFHRWMYTSDEFNQEYISGVIPDFIVLYPDLMIGATSDIKFDKRAETETFTQLGQIVSDISSGTITQPSECETASVTEIFNQLSISGTIKTEAKTKTNMFSIDENSVNMHVRIANDSNEISYGEYTIEYVGNKDSIYKDEYLELKNNDDWDGEKLGPKDDGTGNTVNRLNEMFETDGACQFVKQDIENNKLFHQGIRVMNEFDTNQAGVIDIDNVDVNIIEYVKAYCNNKRANVTFRSVLRPVIYSVTTAAECNMTFDTGMTVWGGHFYPKIYMFTCEQESAGAKGQALVGTFNKSFEDFNYVGTDRHNDYVCKFNESEYYEKTKEVWNTKTNSPFLLVWNTAYPGKKNWSIWQKAELSAFEMGEYVKYFSSEYGTTGIGGIVQRFRFSEAAEGGPTDNRRVAVVLFLKCTEDYYKPVNFFANTWDNVGNKLMVISNANNFSIPNGMKGDYNLSLFTTFYDVVVSMFNQIYIPINTTENITMYIVDTVFYIPKYETSFKVGLEYEIIYQKDNTCSYTINNGLVVNLYFGEDKEVPINDDLMMKLYKENQTLVLNTGNDLYIDNADAPEAERLIVGGGCPSDHEQLKNNIIFNIEKAQETVSYAEYKTINSGNELREEYVLRQNTTYATLIRKNNGKSEISDSSYSNYAYYESDGYFPVLNGEFKIRPIQQYTLAEDGDTIIAEYAEGNLIADNFYNKFTVVDGQLRLNSAFVNDSIDFYSERDHDSGAVEGLSDFAPMKPFKLF